MKITILNVLILLLLLPSFVAGQTEREVLRDSILQVRKQAITSYNKALKSWSEKNKRIDSLKENTPGYDSIIDRYIALSDNIQEYDLLADSYNDIVKENGAKEKPVRETWCTDPKLMALGREIATFMPKSMEPVAPVYSTPYCNLESPDFPVAEARRFLDCLTASKQQNDSLDRVLHDWLKTYDLTRMEHTVRELGKTVDRLHPTLNKDLVIIREKFRKILKKYRHVYWAPDQDGKPGTGHTVD